jgi:hypothetical protein
LSNPTVKISPNPAADAFTIFVQLEKPATVGFEICNFLGQSVHRSDKVLAAENAWNLNAADFANGLYTVRIFAGEYRILRPIVIQK